MTPTPQMKEKRVLRKVKSELLSKDARSLRSGNVSELFDDNLDRKVVAQKSTKIIGGHAMAIRDFNKAKTGKYAKLYDHCKSQIFLITYIPNLYSFYSHNDERIRPE